MRRRTLCQAAATAALLPAAQQAQAQTAAAAPGDPRALLQQRLRQEGVALAAAIVEPERAQFAAAGPRSAGSESGPMVDEDSLFELGSITKTFTALLLADMVVRGELQLDDPVEAVLPGGLKLRDIAGAPLTWADLATHRSGLPRLPDNLKPRDLADPYAGYGRSELLAFIAGWQPMRRRDERHEYSNLGFGLLGEALALRDGSPYASLLRSRVLGPLGLDAMGLAQVGRDIPGLQRGHDAQRRPVPHWHFDAMAGAGALVGSARQLARYAQAALGLYPHPLGPAFTLALNPRADGPGSHNPVGLAWLAGPLFNRRVHNHDGGTFGYSSSLFLDPTRGRAALVLANAMVPVNDLALHLLEPRAPLRDLAAEQRSVQREPVAVDAVALAPLAGRYVLNPQFAIEVRARDGRLFAQASGQGEFELFALDQRRFFARVAPLELHFEGHDGTPPALVLHQGGQRLRFVRE